MNQKASIRVMIVDDHNMVRKGLATFLKAHADLQLVCEASNGNEALQMCERYQPDVVIMDLVMPQMDGPTAIRLIRERYPHIQIIALTSFQEKELVQEALRAGATSYLLKNIAADDLAETIRATYAGRATLAPEVLQTLIQTDQQHPQPGHNLSEREYEVLALLVKGKSNPDIAKNLCVTRSTAKAHVSNILAKLGVHNRAEAVALAIQIGIVD